MNRYSPMAVILPVLAAITPVFGQQEFALPLPEGVKAVWDLSKAYRETTPTLFPITSKAAESISAFFEPNGANSILRGIGPADLHNRDPRELPLITSGATTIGNGVLATATDANVVFYQMVPWQFDPNKQSNLKRTFRRTSFSVTRLLVNLGVASSSPILARFNTPVDSAKAERRWLDGLYLDQPEEWDDPYRFFRW